MIVFQYMDGSGQAISYNLTNDYKNAMDYIASVSWLSDYEAQKIANRFARWFSSVEPGKVAVFHQPTTPKGKFSIYTVDDQLYKPSNIKRYQMDNSHILNNVLIACATGRYQNLEVYHVGGWIIQIKIAYNGNLVLWVQQEFPNGTYRSTGVYPVNDKICMADFDLPDYIIKKLVSIRKSLSYNNFNVV